MIELCLSDKAMREKEGPWAGWLKLEEGILTWHRVSSLTWTTAARTAQQAGCRATSRSLTWSHQLSSRLAPGLSLLCQVVQWSSPHVPGSHPSSILSACVTVGRFLTILFSSVQWE